MKTLQGQYHLFFFGKPKWGLCVCKKIRFVGVSKEIYNTPWFVSNHSETHQTEVHLNWIAFDYKRGLSWLCFLIQTAIIDTFSSVITTLEAHDLRPFQRLLQKDFCLIKVYKDLLIVVIVE